MIFAGSRRLSAENGASSDPSCSPPPRLAGACLLVPLSKKAISNHHSDVRSRSLYGVWVTPPAVAFIAYANLTNDGVFDNVERMLFCELATVGRNLCPRGTMLGPSPLH